MKSYLRPVFPALLCALFLTLQSLDAEVRDGKIYQSSITQVKLYQNQARITRTARIDLQKGQNTIVLANLPRLLYDWSARGSLPGNYQGKIMSLEVEQKALTEKRNRGILEIEKRLEQLHEKDQVLLDELKELKSQQDFLDSILTFTNQTVSKELATRIPQVKVWDDTLSWVSAKKKYLLAEKRRIEKERENTGKEIQKWEFELSQIAGYSYFDTYRSLNQAVMSNRSALQAQQFDTMTTKYAEQRRILSASSEKVDIEKRLIVSVFSASTGSTTITFSYVIPNTYWGMLYDVRASREKQNIEMIIYANIYQKTDEDWNDIELSLSTGSPVNAISPPSLNPWYVDVIEHRAVGEGNALFKSRAPSSKKMEDLSSGAELDEEKEEAAPAIPEAAIEEKGPYLDIKLPVKQNIQSSGKYQKKLIRDYTLEGAEKAAFYYQVTPEVSRTGFLRVKTRNATGLPWLGGEAQIFLENEFMGKAAIPYTPVGKDEDLVLGVEPRITAVKELAKKYEDTAGVFGGDRNILYQYRITLENQLGEAKELVLMDAIPVSQNRKVKVAVSSLSHPFAKDEVFEKSAEYARGMRKWRLQVPSGRKLDITYEVSISFDKSVDIRGLR
jgi:uncharacterized protein (TIGR02231 family)